MKLVITLLFAASAFAQTPLRYSATTGDVSLSGAGTQITIQQPSTAAKLVTLETAAIYCSVACNVTQAQNGAAATTTAGTASPLLPFGPTAAATIWTASNVGAGTPSGGVLHLSAGQTLIVDLSKISFGGTNTNTNYTFAISSITGTANITFTWNEQ